MLLVMGATFPSSALPSLHSPASACPPSLITLATGHDNVMPLFPILFPQIPACVSLVSPGLNGSKSSSGAYGEGSCNGPLGNPFLGWGTKPYQIMCRCKHLTKAKIGDVKEDRVWMPLWPKPNGVTWFMVPRWDSLLPDAALMTEKWWVLLVYNQFIHNFLPNLFPLGNSVPPVTLWVNCDCILGPKINCTRRRRGGKKEGKKKVNAIYCNLLQSIRVILLLSAWKSLCGLNKSEKARKVEGEWSEICSGL